MPSKEELEEAGRQEGLAQVAENQQKAQAYQDKIDAAEFEEKVQLTDDPIGAIVVEIARLKQSVEDANAFAQSVWEVATEAVESAGYSKEILDNLLVDGYAELQKSGRKWVISGHYRGPHWCYPADYAAIGDGLVCWNTGGAINVGRLSTNVGAGDIASELDVTTNEYLFYDMSIVQATGVISQAYITNSTISTSSAAQDHLWIPLIRYSKTAGGVVTIHEQLLTKTPEAQTLKHVADSGTSWWLGSELRVTTTEYD